MEKELDRTGRISLDYRADCGRCLDWEYLAGQKKREAAQHARQLGWKKTKKLGWICSVCVKELEERKRDATKTI